MLGSNSSVAEHKPVSNRRSSCTELPHEMLHDRLPLLLGDEPDAYHVSVGLIQRTMHLHFNDCAGLCILLGESLNVQIPLQRSNDLDFLVLLKKFIVNLLSNIENLVIVFHKRGREFGVKKKEPVSGLLLFLLDVIL